MRIIKFKNIAQVLAIIFVIVVTQINSYAGTIEGIYIAPIFTQEQGVWYPGRIESKDFYIANNQGDNISIDRLYMKLKSIKNIKTNEVIYINSKKFKELSENSIVKLTYNKRLLFKGKLSNLLSKKDITLPYDININSNEKVILNMTLYMDKEMNNDAQSIESIFNIGVSYKVNSSADIGGSTVGDNNSENIVGNNHNNLPQTGGVINSASLLLLGTIIVGTGMILNKKSSNNEGGKRYE